MTGILLIISGDNEAKIPIKMLEDDENIRHANSSIPHINSNCSVTIKSLIMHELKSLKLLMIVILLRLLAIQV